MNGLIVFQAKTKIIQLRLNSSKLLSEFTYVVLKREYH